MPVFALVHLGLFLTAATLMISLVNTGAILNWPLPPDVPVWAAASILLIAYQIVVAPVRAAQHWSWQPPAGAQPPWYAFWQAVSGLLGLAFVIWISSEHMPEIREFLRQLPGLIQEFAQAVRNLWVR